jgi:uncharacterized membrane protein
MRPLSFGFGLAICVLASPSSPSAQQTADVEYVLRDLGTVDNSTLSVAVVINDRGEVAGWSQTSTGASVPFYWTEKTGFIKFLGDFPGSPVDISEKGQVVGWFYRNLTLQGFLWSVKDGFVDLGAFLPNAINDRGDMVGQCDISSPTPCMLSASGDLRRLSVPDDGFAVAVDINNRGDIIGYVSVDPRSHAVIWRKDEEAFEILEPTPDEGYEFVAPHDINDHGIIVGAAEVLGGLVRFPVIWDKPGEGTVVESVPGQATNINNKGLVTLFAESPNRMLVWDLRRNTFTELPSLGGIDQPFASGLNDRGVIVGSSSTPAGDNHAVIWEPVRSGRRDQ